MTGFSKKTATILSLALLLAAPLAHAQDAALAPAATPVASPNVFTTKALAADEVTLRAGSRLIRLWGIQPVEGSTAVFHVQARTALDNKIGNVAIQCDTKGGDASIIQAQCVNKQEVDLSLYMLQNGYVMADRALVYGTAYEEAYVSAERQAQQKQLGIWADDKSDSDKRNDTLNGIRLILIAIGLLLAFFAGTFVFLASAMMRSFRSFMNAQERGNELMHKEQNLKVQERKLVASMIEAELRANKSKIEAYLLIYGEMLKSIRDGSKAPSYTKTGDIVQMQPALDRAVFDRNTDKMDLLGRRLASEVIHFYARIKTNPDYVNLEPDTPIIAAREYVEKAVNNAHKLDDLLTSALDQFVKSGLSQSEE